MITENLWTYTEISTYTVMNVIIYMHIFMLFMFMYVHVHLCVHAHVHVLVAFLINMEMDTYMDREIGKWT
jgi:hypothetical protein